MKPPKKDQKTKSTKSEAGAADAGAEYGTISTKADLRAFLQNIRDKMAEEVAPAIYVLGAMNHIMNLDEINAWLDNENKELARDIWLRLKQSGLVLRNPPLLFSPEENGAVAQDRR